MKAPHSPTSLKTPSGERLSPSPVKEKISAVTSSDIAGAPQHVYDNRRTYGLLHSQNGDSPALTCEEFREKAQEDDETESRSASPQSDALFEKAAQFVRDFIDHRHRTPSVSDLQSALRISYLRARKLMRQLESRKNIRLTLHQ